MDNINELGRADVGANVENVEIASRRSLLQMTGAVTQTTPLSMASFFEQHLASA